MLRRGTFDRSAFGPGYRLDFVCALAVPAVALRVPQEPRQSEAWRFEVVPYLWGASLDGTVGFGGLGEVELDAGFAELFENVDFAAATFFTARKGRTSILADFSYVSLEAEETVGASTVAIGSDLTWFALAAGRALDTGPDLDLDVFAGLRYYAVANDARSSGGIVGERDDSEAWIDPFVGFKLAHQLGPSVGLHFLADVGGFGVGSDLTYEVMPSVAFRLSEAVSLRLAYRWMDVDYEDSDFEWDVRQSGFALGLGIAF